jgi:transposase
MDSDPNARRKGVTARIYQEVLNQHLLPMLQFGTIFMHDNAPIHTAHLIRDFLNAYRIDVMDWPPYSLDLNPIENLWALLKAEMY